MIHRQLSKPQKSDGLQSDISDMFYSFTKETKIHSVLVVMKNCV